MIRFILFLFLMLGKASIVSQAQNYLYPVDSIYLSGVVFDVDSVTTLPFAKISANQKLIGIADANGQFIVKINRKDTVHINYIGFKDFTYVFPEKTFRDEFFIRVALSRDYVALKAVEIYPWPKKGAFKQAFLDANVAAKKDVPLVIPGAVQYDGPRIEPEPSVANPASLLQKALGKESRRKRKLEKYRKQLQEDYYEFQR